MKGDENSYSVTSINCADIVTMSKRKHPEGEPLREAGAQEIGNAPKRRKSKDKGKIEIRHKKKLFTPNSVENNQTKRDRKSKRSKEKTNGAIKEDELEDSERPTLPSSEVRVDSAHNASTAAESPTTKIQLPVQKEGENGLDRPKKHKKRRRGQDDGLRSVWTKLEAVGGLMMDLDPIFSSDEEYDRNHSLVVVTLTVTGTY